MHDAAPDDYVRCPDLEPLLSLEPRLSHRFGEQVVADGTVVAVGVDPRVALRYRQGPHEVGPANDTDKPAVAEDRHALDPFCLEQHCDIGEFGRVGDRDNLARHDVLCRAAVRFGVVAGELLVRRDRIEPPRAPPPPGQTLRLALGPGLDTVQQVTLAHDADQTISGIDNGNPADAAFGKELRHCLHRRVWVDGDHPGCHNVHRAHRNSSRLQE